MSRSYKKNPYCGLTKDKFMKKYSNHVIRQKLKDMDFSLSGKEFRKVVGTWNICDYYSRLTFEEYYAERIKWWNSYRKLYEPFPTREKSYKEWCKWYRRK